jgi:plastocyanin
VRISYRALIPVALLALVVSAWLALPGNAQGEDLPGTVAALETRVAEMESRIGALETQIATPVPAASPEAEPAALTITMFDLAFEPKTVTIPADTPVTITLVNQGFLPHNLSIPDHDVSVNVKGGETSTVVVTLPAGEYRFVCGIPGHTEAGMTGTLVVE